MTSINEPTDGSVSGRATVRRLAFRRDPAEAFEQLLVTISALSKGIPGGLQNGGPTWGSGFIREMGDAQNLAGAISIAKADQASPSSTGALRHGPECRSRESRRLIVELPGPEVPLSSG